MKKTDAKAPSKSKVIIIPNPPQSSSKTEEDAPCAAPVEAAPVCEAKAAVPTPPAPPVQPQTPAQSEAVKEEKE